MGLSVKTKLMIGIQVSQSDLPEGFMDEYWANEDHYFDKHTKISVEPISCYDDGDVVIGYEIGKLEEMDEKVITKDLSFVETFVDTVTTIISKKLDPTDVLKNQRAKLIMWHQAS